MQSSDEKWIIENVVKIYLDYNAYGVIQNFVNSRSSELGFRYDHIDGKWIVTDEHAFMLTMIKYE